VPNRGLILNQTGFKPHKTIHLSPRLALPHLKGAGDCQCLGFIVWPGPTRTIPCPFIAPQSMLPFNMKTIPPNMRFSSNPGISPRDWQKTS